MRNRRELLTASAALAAGAAAAGLVSCGGDDPDTESTETVSTAEMQNDVALLNALLDLEQSAVEAYARIGPGLGEPFAEHERSHAAVLRRLIGELGGRALPSRPAEEYRAGFPPLRDERDALLFALDVETTSIGAYGDALGKIATGGVQVTLAGILAAESEHAAVLLGRLERPRVPDAFVTGSPPAGAG
jgi:hypothetical protein